ncbi:pilin [Patescibacteria group bacterium]|nr:pilin [Patescibacteria group bacterium]
MKKLSYILLIIFVVGVIFFIPVSTSAIATTCPGTPCPAGQICIENPLCAESFEDLLNTIVNFIFWIAIAIAPLMIMIAAFFLLTAGGDPKRIDTAKQIILWTVIGLAIILLAKGLISVLRQIIGVQ